MRDCFIVSRNASPGQRRWECLNMRMLADPVLGWKGGMRSVIKFFNTGRGILEFGSGDQNVKRRAGCPGMCEWHVNIP